MIGLDKKSQRLRHITGIGRQQHPFECGIGIKDVDKIQSRLREFNGLYLGSILLLRWSEFIFVPILNLSDCGLERGGFDLILTLFIFGLLQCSLMSFFEILGQVFHDVSVQLSKFDLVGRRIEASHEGVVFQEGRQELIASCMVSFVQW